MELEYKNGCWLNKSSSRHKNKNKNNRRHKSIKIKIITFVALGHGRWIHWAESLVAKAYWRQSIRETLKPSCLFCFRLRKDKKKTIFTNKKKITISWRKKIKLMMKNNSNPNICRAQEVISDEILVECE